MRTLKNKLILVSLLLVSLVFQNCGRLDESASLIVDDPRIVRQTFEEIFNYSYTSAPKVFGQVQFVSKPTTRKFEDVAFIAVMGRADGATGVFDYEISIKNQSGFPVCPTVTGRLSGGSTSVTDGCVSQVNSSSVIVDLKVTEIVGTKKTVYKFQRKYD
ncbi:MAG: hypothetical protein KF767_00210 [Bdellovibrionaceae bacterium]|nr:hypothetical protein [Pseudobdellovibrionaceae bacterium]